MFTNLTFIFFSFKQIRFGLWNSSKSCVHPTRNLSHLTLAAVGLCHILLQGPSESSCVACWVWLEVGPVVRGVWHGWNHQILNGNSMCSGASDVQADQNHSFCNVSQERYKFGFTNAYNGLTTKYRLHALATPFSIFPIHYGVVCLVSSCTCFTCCILDLHTFTVFCSNVLILVHIDIGWYWSFCLLRWNMMKPRIQ